MARSVDYSLAAPEQIARDLGRRVEQLRLGRNLRRVDLAVAAGLSLRTLARLETTGHATLDTVIRVLVALELHANLQVLFPEPTLRPIERVTGGGEVRRRARPAKAGAKRGTPWTWGDES